MSKLSASAVPALLLFGSILGCSDGNDQTDAKPGDFAQPEGLQQALTNPIIDCQTTAVTCLQGATDFTTQGACNDALAQCLQDAATKGQDIAKQVDTCRTDGLSCLQGGGDLLDCQKTYLDCSQTALSGGVASDSDAGLSLPDGPLTSLDAGLPGLPSLPSGGNLPPLPALPGLADAGVLLDNLPAPVKCTVELQLCVFNDPTAAMACGDTAKTCLMLP